MQRTVAFRDYDDATRQEMAKKGLALPDGSFPIRDKQDLEDALHRIGTTKHPRAEVIAFIRKRAKALGAMNMLGDKTAPRSANGATSHDRGSVKFSTEKHVLKNGNILRRGKVFEAGSRLDMHGIPFTVTQPELNGMVVNFRPFPVGSGHPEAPSPLDGKLGRVTNLFLGKNPNDLWADVEIPPFVDDVLGNEDVKVSMVFDRSTKEPLGLDFVNEPNVVDAALMASFAKTKRQRSNGVDWKKFWTGLFTAAESHDGSAAFAAPGNDGDEFESDWQEQAFGGQQPSNDDDDDDKPETEGTETMTAAHAQTQTPRDVSAMAAMQARNIQLEADLARERASRIESEAVAFAEGEIGTHRSLPAERDGMIELFGLMAAADMALGTVKMSGNQTSLRTERLKAIFASRPEHWMTKEMLSSTISPEVIAMAAETAKAGAPKPMDSDAKARLLAMTPLGQAAVKNGKS